MAHRLVAIHDQEGEALDTLKSVGSEKRSLAQQIAALDHAVAYGSASDPRDAMLLADAVAGH